jgi:hypothetical protein
MVGSGVVFDARRGLIITNSHVINHADDIKVRFTDGRALPARRVGADPETDVAVIQVRADGLMELPFGDSDRLEVGDFVFAVGNPRQIGQTVSAGIVGKPKSRVLHRLSSTTLGSPNMPGTWPAGWPRTRLLRRRTLNWRVRPPRIPGGLRRARISDGPGVSDRALKQ